MVDIEMFEKKLKKQRKVNRRVGIFMLVTVVYAAVLTDKVKELRKETELLKMVQARVNVNTAQQSEGE